EAVSKTNRVAVLFLPASSRILSESSRKEREIAAQALGIRLISLPVRELGDIEAALETAKENVHALLASPNPLLNTVRERIVELAGKNRLPAMYGGPEFVEAGGLMSYAPSYADLFRRAATYVDKILKGAKPADLPVEQPTKFDLVINLKNRQGPRPDDPAVGPATGHASHPIAVRERGQLLRAAVGFAGCSLPSYRQLRLGIGASASRTPLQTCHALYDR